jgi:signal peptidase II
VQAAARATLNPHDPGSSEPGSDDPDVTTRPRSSRYVVILLVVAATVVLVDRVTKTWAVDRLGDGEVIVLADPWMQLRLVYNPGAAFGFAGGYTVVISIIAFGVAFAILRLSRRLRSVWWAIALGGILGGALGNLIDRMTQPPGIFRGYVIDFVEWPGFPVWNLADAAIVGSVALVFVLSLRDVPYDQERPAAGSPTETDDGAP